MKFEEQKFSIPTLKGISAKTIEEHLKLYSGYVKNANLILEKVEELKKDSVNAYAQSEIMRRFGFEFNGMRNHEIYFKSFEGGAKSLSESEFRTALDSNWNSFESWLTEFKALALTRGIGWAILYYDKVSNKLLNAWVDEQHLGQLQNCVPIIALDMWEHSYVADYQPSGKKQYVEDYFANLNWKVVEENFKKAQLN